jgi:hypothetical protein
MLVLTNILLLMAALMFGMARRPWWQIGLLALVTCGPPQLAQFWAGDWRYGVGLPYHEESLNAHVVGWIVGWLLFFAYGGYALGFLYSRWRRI